MPAIYTCDCQDSRVLTGTAKWSPDELRQMNPLQLSDALSEITEFAKYYSVVFFIPRKQLETELHKISNRYQLARQWAVCFGIVTGVFTVLWMLLVAIPSLRFSALTMILAVFTVFSILILIPIILWFISAQEDYTKRYPRLLSKREELLQKIEKEIFGKYADYLVTGFILTPDYCLYEEGLQFMISALNSKRATNLSEAAMLCKKKLGLSPVPRIVKAIHSAGGAKENPAQNLQSACISQSDEQENGLENLVLLSSQLQTAIKRFAAAQTVTNSSAEKQELTIEEQSVLDDYRCLTDEEKKRIRRVLHSLCSGQY